MPAVPRDPVLLAECRALAAAVAGYPTLAALEGAPRWPGLRERIAAVLGTIRRHAPAAEPPPPADPARVRLVQWNLEHGNRYERIEAALRSHPQLADADLLALEEVDLGCARTDLRDVAGDLAARLGRHAVWAPLFLETTVGRDDDVALATGRANEEGLFGMAVLSRWPIGEARVVELPSPRRRQFDAERMLGRHIALVAEILRPAGAFVAVATHLEVHRTRAHRAEQVRHLVAALADEPRPVALAGDFNSHTFDRGRRHSALSGALVLGLTPGPLLRRRLLRPDRGTAHEPLFDVLARAGFRWREFSDDRPTLRLRDTRLEELRALPRALRATAARLLGYAVRRGELRLDWICVRGCSGGRGHTVQGLDGPGRASDHAPIVAELEP